MKLFIVFAVVVTLASNIGLSYQQSTNTTTIAPPSSDVVLEFDESDIRNLNLKIKWRFGSDLQKNATRFVLLMETKRINFTTFLYDYSSPQLIDDETVIRASQMKPENFKKRVVLQSQSNLDCSMNCINSTRFNQNMPGQSRFFDCNIFYYDSTVRTCILYEYDFFNEYPKKRFLQPDEISEYFNEECDMDEILGDVIGYSRLCRRILDYRAEHIIKINPYIDYRFSISLRDQNFEWTPFLRREYQYAPKITIDVKGDVKLGNNITLECNTELSDSIVDSISWKNSNPTNKGVLYISPLTVTNMQQTYYCEIRFNFFRMIQKAYKLNLTTIGDLKPKLKIGYTADEENLNVNIKWNTSMPIGTRFKPEKMVLLYSENNQTYKPVNKYLLFELSKFDNSKLVSLRDIEDMTTANEDECAMACLQKNFCDHFVFLARSVESYYSKNSRKKNCRLVANNFDNLFPCRYDMVCANLSPFEKHVQNETLSILILPNITYRFKLQLKDQHLNWTDVQETDPIFIPLKMSIEQTGQTNVTDNVTTSSAKFELTCHTNINKNIQHQISWFKDDKELLVDGTNFTSYSLNDTQNANSVLVFRNYQNQSAFNYNGAYKCNIYIRYPEVGQGASYQSEPKSVSFSYIHSLRYETSVGNISLPTVPGVLLELDCQVYGQPVRSLKWLVDGVNYNEKTALKLIPDEPFVINITDQNEAATHNILVMKIDYAKQAAKYECILNDNITVKSYYIEIIDQKPDFELSVDKSELNKLKLTINVRVKNTAYKSKYSTTLSNPISMNPSKISIMYAQNSTLQSTLQTIIAPNTLSRTDVSWKPTETDKIKIGTLKSTQHGIQSCKVVCFKTPYCKSYEYAMYDDSCYLYSNSQIENQYRKLIDSLKNISTWSETRSLPVTFNLINLLQEYHYNLAEDNLFANVTLLDKKKYPGCEPKPSQTLFDDELDCSDQLAEFNQTYTMGDLLPATSYQFRVELASAFGVSATRFTESVQVPFTVNPIEEKNKAEVYSLECSTPLVNTEYLKFAWFKNEQPIGENDTRYEILRPADRASTTSELRFKANTAVNYNGLYTCSLTFVKNDELMLTQNQTYLFKQDVKFTYMKYPPNVMVNKGSSETWADSCAAQGWPLPTIAWHFNGSPVSNKTDSLLNVPYTITHHRNITVTAYLIAQNLTTQSSGFYQCVVNSQLPIKNVTLTVRPPPTPATTISQSRYIISTTVPNGPQKSDDVYVKEQSTRTNYAFITIVTIILIACLSLVSYVVYYKRKRSKLNALLSYNRIEEELVTGVDNVNLTDDNL